MFIATHGLLQGNAENSVDDEQVVQNNRQKANENIEKRATDIKKGFVMKRKSPTQYKIKDLVLWNKSEAGPKDVRRKLK